MDGKIVLITGGLRGIGRATADRMADLGALVVVTSRRAGDPMTQLDDKATQPLLKRLDVRDEHSVLELFAWLDGELGRLDVLVNNAGAGTFKTIEEMTLTEWSNVIGTNLTGAFLCAREAFKRMKAQGGGRIINVGSIADHIPIPGNSAYGASKFGLRGLSLILAEEGAAHHVRVSLVSPGAVSTDIWRGREGFDLEDMLSPHDVAETIVDIARRPLSVRIDEVRLSPPRGVL